MSAARRLTTMIALTLLIPAAAATQERRQGGPPPYDLSSEKTVTGTIVGTDTISPPDRPVMQYLTITVDGSRLQVILAPDSWMKQQKFTFKAGATIEVTGVHGFRLNSEPAVMARKLKSDAQTLDVRDAQGKPRWE